MAKIVYANTIDYNMVLQQRPHHIMNKLAERGHQIYWVNQYNRNNLRFRQKVNKNLSIYNGWNEFCNTFIDEIDIYFASWSHRWTDVEMLKPKHVIYDSLDLFPQNEVFEKKMVDKADVILTTAKGLYDYHKKHTNKPIYMCENGCFNEYRNINKEPPKDLQDIINHNMPIILFSGALSLDKKSGWVDIEILREITKKYYIVVVGIPWGFNQTLVNANKDVFNKLIYIGSKDYELLQQYYANCTVNILPFKRCQVSDYSFPLKTIEGCNHGKICVSSDIPVSVEINKKYPKAVMISKTPNEFVRNIDIAIKESANEENIKQCYQLADEHDWNKKVDIIENIISELMESKND